MLLAGALPARAGTLAGVSLPDSVDLAGTHLVLDGMGLRTATFLHVKVYVAGLYLPRPSSNAREIIAANEPKLLVLRFVRNVGRGDVVKAWREGFARNATVPPAQLQAEIDQLNAWMVDFRRGDTLAFTFLPGQGVAVDINGARRGVLPGEAFAQSLLAIWLGPHPPNDELKRGLLGNRGVGG
jgi:hypothetical protein